MYKNFYKKAIRKEEQQKERRATCIKAQKQQRAAAQDIYRNITDLEMDVDVMEANVLQAAGHRKFKKLALRPQLPQWLKERPSDLQNWFLVPFPKGKRCIVVACNGCTKVYDACGIQFLILRTPLPGDLIQRKLVTILDCIFTQNEVFFVLDVLKFASVDMISSATYNRFYCLNTKFLEYNINPKHVQEQYQFCMLKHYDFAAIEFVVEALLRYPHWPNNTPEIEGFMFYHKQAHYMCTSTPNFCWLPPFMITDVIDMPVSALYKKPSEYINHVQYMQLVAQLEWVCNSSQNTEIMEYDQTECTSEPMEEDTTESY